LKGQHLYNEDNKRFKATTYGSLIALMPYNDLMQLKNLVYQERLIVLLIYKGNNNEGKTSPVEGDFIPSYVPIEILKIIPSYYYNLLN